MSMTAGLIRVDKDELKSIIGGEVSLDGYLFPEDDTSPENSCDLYKAWNGVLFLLGKLAKDGDSVLNRAVLGGTPFADDMGYGPPMYISATDVAEINKLLTDIDEAGFRSAFDATEMAGANIYCFDPKNATEDLDFYVSHYLEMQTFYEKAAMEKQSVIQYLV